MIVKVLPPSWGGSSPTEGEVFNQMTRKAVAPAQHCRCFFGVVRVRRVPENQTNLNPPPLATGNLMDLTRACSFADCHL